MDGQGAVIKKQKGAKSVCFVFQKEAKLTVLEEKLNAVIEKVDTKPSAAGGYMRLNEVN